MRQFLHYLPVLFIVFSAKSQIITTVAGNKFQGYSPDGTTAITAQLNNPRGIAVSSDGSFYFSEPGNNIVRKIDASGKLVTVAGNYGLGGGYSGDGGLATQALLSQPLGLAFDDLDNLYISDNNNHAVRKVDKKGIITTVAGIGLGGYNGDDIPATTARLAGVWNVAFYNGSLYIADGYSRIRKVDNKGIITTVAGGQNVGYSGDGGKAVNALLYNPTDVCFDKQGNMYIADVTNYVVRKVDAAGNISTVAGDNSNNGGPYSYTDDGGPATAAALARPVSITADAAGNIYIADLDKNVIRMVSIKTGKITTLVNQYKLGVGGYTGDGGPAADAKIASPQTVRIDEKGNMYINDAYNNVIRKIYGGVLSAKIASFTAFKKGNAYLLSWQTLEEINTAGFEVERKEENNTPFTVIGYVPAVSNENKAQSYKYEDYLPNGGTHYYRLKIIDKNGYTTYSKILSVNGAIHPFTATLLPNPVNNTATIRLVASVAAEINVQVINLNGKVMQSNSFKINEGTNTNTINIQNLASGAYILNLSSSGGNTMSLKMIKR